MKGDKYFTWLIEDVSERNEAMNKLQSLAERDHLTGLLNRTLFHFREQSA